MFSLPSEIYCRVSAFIFSKSRLPSSLYAVASTYSPKSPIARSPTSFPAVKRACASSPITYSSGLYFLSHGILGHCLKSQYLDLLK